MTIESDCCAVCGLSWPILERAHVKPQREFDQNRSAHYDSDYNIINLCPNHHKMLDKLKLLLICPNKKHVLIQPPGSGVTSREMHTSPLIKDEYIRFRINQTNIDGINSYSDVYSICGCEG